MLFLRQIILRQTHLPLKQCALKCDVLGVLTITLCGGEPLTAQSGSSNCKHRGGAWARQPTFPIARWNRREDTLWLSTVRKPSWSLGQVRGDRSRLLPRSAPGFQAAGSTRRRAAGVSTRRAQAREVPGLHPEARAVRGPSARRAVRRARRMGFLPRPPLPRTSRVPAPDGETEENDRWR